jgi:hypothetical protein
MSVCLLVCTVYNKKHIYFTPKNNIDMRIVILHGKFVLCDICYEHSSFIHNVLSLIKQVSPTLNILGDS